MMTSVLKVT